MKHPNPWGRVPLAVIKEMGPYGTAVYAVLAEAMNSTTGCWAVPRSRIVETSGISRAKTTMVLGDLEQAGWINVERQTIDHPKGKQQLPSIYSTNDLKRPGSAVYLHGKLISEGVTTKHTRATTEHRGGLPQSTGVGYEVAPKENQTQLPDPTRENTCSSDDERSCLDAVSELFTEQPKNPPKTPSAKTAATAMFVAEFDVWWKRYPRKEGRKPALAKFVAARKSGVPLAVLDAGLDRYLRSVVGTDRQFRLHAATWLDQERWTDEVTPVAGRPMVEMLGEEMPAVFEPKGF